MKTDAIHLHFTSAAIVFTSLKKASELHIRSLRSEIDRLKDAAQVGNEINLWHSTPPISALVRERAETSHNSHMRSNCGDFQSLFNCDRVLWWLLHESCGWHLFDSQSFVTLNTFSASAPAAESQRTEERGPRLQKLPGGRDETCFTATKTHLSCVKELRRWMKGPLYIFRCHGSADWPRSGEAAGADMRQVALMLRLTSVHAKHYQAVTHPHYHAFLDWLSPSLLQVRCRGWKQLLWLQTAPFFPKTVVSHLHTQPEL